MERRGKPNVGKSMWISSDVKNNTPLCVTLGFSKMELIRLLLLHGSSPFLLATDVSLSILLLGSVSLLLSVLSLWPMASFPISLLNY